MAKKSITIINKRELNWKKDIIYNSIWFTKLVNCLVIDGKKIKMEKELYKGFKLLKLKKNLIAIYTYFEILEIVKPLFQIISIKKGKQSYKVPFPLKNYKRYGLSVKWFIKIIKKHTHKDIASLKLNKRLSFRIYQALNVIIKKENWLQKEQDLIKEILIFNRPYAHFRW